MSTLKQNIDKTKPEWVFIFRKDAHDHIKKAIGDIPAAYFIGDYRSPMLSEFVRFSHLAKTTLVTYKCKQVWTQLKNPMA